MYYLCGFQRSTKLFFHDEPMLKAVASFGAKSAWGEPHHHISVSVDKTATFPAGVLGEAYLQSRTRVFKILASLSGNVVALARTIRTASFYARGFLLPFGRTNQTTKYGSLATFFLDKSDDYRFCHNS